MKKYLKYNKDVFKLINRKDIKILEIRPIKRIRISGIFKESFISSYCVKYEKI